MTTKIPDMKDTMEAEQMIRRELHMAGVEFNLITAAALLSIASDHFADHPLLNFLNLMRDLHYASGQALRAGALCGRCRAELQGGVCDYCSGRLRAVLEPLRPNLRPLITRLRDGWIATYQNERTDFASGIMACASMVSILLEKARTPVPS